MNCGVLEVHRVLVFTEVINGPEYFPKHIIQCASNACWACRPSLRSLTRSQPSCGDVAVDEATGLLPEAPVATAGGTGRRRMVLCGSVADGAASSWLGLFGGVSRARSLIMTCGRLSGRVFHLCVQPFAVWDSTHYSIKPIVSQQPSIMQNSGVPQICQEIKRLLALL